MAANQQEFAALLLAKVRLNAINDEEDFKLNLERSISSKAIKYLFKYITKGDDRATIVLEHTSSGRIHHKKPHVQKLALHLEGEASVVIGEDVVTRVSLQETMFNKWMETNERDQIGRSLTYTQFPKMFVWEKTKMNWSRKDGGTSIGRILHTSPSEAEQYYLRMMINQVKGCGSFKEIRTVAGVTYETCKESCYAMGLLDGDKEWHEATDEASEWASPFQLRELFVTIIIYCEVTDSLKLWGSCWRSLSEDILPMQLTRLNFQGLNLGDEEVQHYVVIELQKLLNQSDKSLTDYINMSVYKEIFNKETREEIQQRQPIQK